MEIDLTCYAYIPQTFEYVCPVQADLDPLDEGNVLWPGNTTRVKPPAFGANQIPVFNEGTKKWTVVPDYRGAIWYDPDGAEVLVRQSGDPATFDPPLTQEAPPPPPPPPPTEEEQNFANRTSKVAFFRRCTDSEAAQFVADLTDASPRLKAIFDSVSYLIPGTEEYPQLRAAVEARVDPARADQLLAPSND